MDYDVDIVDVPAHWALALRRRGPLADIGATMRRLRELAAEAGVRTTGPMAARFYEYAGPDEDADYEVVIGVLPTAGGSPPETVGEARCTRQPSHQALEAVHHGPHDQMDGAWSAVRAACAARGRSPAGPVSEMYEVTRADGVPPEQYLTRVRLPLTR
jgi:effector-binding domain-containing protein